MEQDERAGQRPSFVYHYRYLDARGSTFGMTYSPALRTEQRVGDTAPEPELQDAFRKRLDRLDWLSSAFPDRRWSYWLECYIKRLATVATSSAVPALARSAATDISRRLLARTVFSISSVSGTDARRCSLRAVALPFRSSTVCRSVRVRWRCRTCTPNLYRDPRFLKRIRFSGAIAPAVHVSIPSDGQELLLHFSMPIGVLFRGFVVDLVLDGPERRSLLRVRSSPCRVSACWRRDLDGRLLSLVWSAPQLPDLWGLAWRFSLVCAAADGHVLCRSRWRPDETAAISVPRSPGVQSVNLVLLGRVVSPAFPDIAFVPDLVLWRSSARVPVVVSPARRPLPPARRSLTPEERGAYPWWVLWPGDVR